MVSLNARVINWAMRQMMKLSPADIPLETQRRQGERMALERVRPGTAVRSDHLDGVPVEWIVPPGAARDRVLLYLHGGGYIQATPGMHRPLVARLAAAAGITAVMPAYRLAPEHPFPAALEDALAVYRALLAQGIAPRHILFGGDSAGGGLALAALVSLRDAGDALPAGAFLISAWADLTLSGELAHSRPEIEGYLRLEDLRRAAAQYAGATPLDHPLVSPCFADLSGLPPLLLQVGEREILRDDAVEIVRRVQAAGGQATLEIWDGMMHLWHLMARFMPESRQAIQRLGDFARSAVDAPAPKA